jgi:predicted negative regulator of RcsB-dependent stress response
MDIRGILGMDSDVRNGYDDIKVTFTIDADASKPEIEAIVSLRQARIALNRGEHDRAIEIATGIKSEAFAGLAAEVRGDALVAAGRSDDARAAYQEALTALETGAANRSIVEMKLADLGGLQDAPEA